ncbi:MAG: 2Fe-2S iron-sulfur cluster-binding protein [Gammaproteobacteria bacterium]
MTRLLSVSRAARLVGITRGALQKRIRQGDLESFEGDVSLDDLAQLFPDMQIEDKSMREKMDRFIETALQRARYKKLSELTLPDSDTLLARVRSLSREIVDLQDKARLYQDAFERLNRQIQSIPLDAPGVAVTALHALQQRLQELPAPQQHSGSAMHLFTTDTLLRLMMAQVHIQPSGEEFYIEGETSILESALSAGLPINYGCSNGNCGKCKARLISGEVRQVQPYDYVLSNEEKANHTFLSCCHTATTDIIIEAEIAGHASDIPQQNISAQIKKIVAINPHMQSLKLRTPRTQRLRFLAGQSAQLRLADGSTTSLSIASCPCDDMNIEFHVPVNTDEPFFQQLQLAKNNDKLELQGPEGDFVLDYHDTRPLVMVAMNDRFAAIKSLIEHAVTLESAEYIHLYWLISEPDHHYLDNVCRSWADAFEQFRYQVIAIDKAPTNSLPQALETISAQHRASEDALYYIDVLPEYRQVARDTLSTTGIEAERLHINSSDTQ